MQMFVWVYMCHGASVKIKELRKVSSFTLRAQVISPRSRCGSKCIFQLFSCCILSSPINFCSTLYFTNSGAISASGRSLNVHNATNSNSARIWSWIRICCFDSNDDPVFSSSYVWQVKLLFEERHHIQC